MKASEAITKVCPFTIGQPSEGVLIDHEPELIGSKCICDGCMAWVDTTKIKYIDEIYVVYMDGEPSKAEKLITKDHVLKSSNGDKENYRQEFWGIPEMDKNSEGYCSRLKQ